MPYHQTTISAATMTSQAMQMGNTHAGQDGSVPQREDDLKACVLADLHGCGDIDPVAAYIITPNAE